MKNTGIVRRIDGLGRIVIPKELRDTIGAPEGTPMEIFTEDNGLIVIKKYEPACVFCGETNGVIEYKGKKICEKCQGKIREANND